MDINSARQIISDMDQGKIQWDDNKRAAANNIIDAADPVKQAQKIADQSLQNAQKAQQLQIQANQPAIQTLQTQKADLGQQYKDLLSSVTQQGNVGIDTATRNQNAFLASRGIYSQGGIGGDVISNAQAQAASQAKANEAAVQTSQSQDIGNLAAQIASLQAGNVPNSLGFASNIANLTQQAQLIPAQQQLLQGQATQTHFLPIPGYGVYDLTKGQLIGGLSGIPGQGVTNVNGVPSLWVP